MAVTFTKTQYANGSGSTTDVLYYTGDINDFQIDKVSNTSKADLWSSNSHYGTNASFFAPKNGYQDLDAMTTFHIYNETFVRPFYKNYEDYFGSSGEMGCMLFYTNGASQFKTKLGSVPNDSPSGIKLGIGGYDLMVNNSSITSATTLNSQLKLTYPAVSAIAPTSLRNRTAIGYTSNGKIILAAFLKNPVQTSPSDNGASLYDVRQFLIGKGCTNVLNLDGGGSTQISYKNNNVNTYSTMGRPVWCRIRIKSTSTITWN